MFKKRLLGLLVAFVLGSWVSCFAEEENVWLHVDGRYIKTADGNNFVPAGIDYIASDTAYGSPEDVLAWCKKFGVNTIRVSLREEQNKDDIEGYLKTYVDPKIEACKIYGIYAFIDQHNYFHEFNPGDGFLPTGDIWEKDRVQLWVDNWRKIADRYKDEPWVMGYELLNEPYNIGPDMTRDFYLQALKAIREVDKKHIIILGTNQFTHIENAEETWASVKFKPDEPINQVVFAFHEYTKAHDPSYFAPVLDKIMKKYNVPLLCTEFGSDMVVEGVTVEERRQFEVDMFAALKKRQIGWTIWRLQGTPPNLKCDYEDIWQPAAKDQGTTTAVVMKGNIECTSSAKSVIADNKTPVVITATIKDFDGKTIATADNMVKFTLSGEGILEGENPAKAVNGVAAIKLKFAKPGIVRIIAVSRGLYNGKVEVSGKSDRAMKLLCSAEPASIPADGKSVSIISAVISDANGNIVDNGQVCRVNCGGPEYVDTRGKLWLADKTYSEGSWGYTASRSIDKEKGSQQFKNTQDNMLYYTCRAMNATEGYRFTVPNGKYNVELLFSENWFGVTRNEETKGSRIFDILINNEAKVKDLDIYDKAGGPLTAYSETCPVEVKNGILEIFANNKVDQCEIRAISITPEVPSANKITFSATGGTLEGTNPADPVCGKAVINLKSGATAGKAKVTASYPVLTAGTVEVTVGK